MMKIPNFLSSFTLTAILAALFILGPIPKAEAMNKSELVDAIAKEAHVSQTDAASIYESLVKELSKAAEDSGVEFQPFGYITKEDGREEFYGLVTMIKGVDLDDTQTFTAKITIALASDTGPDSVDSFFDVWVEAVGPADIPTGETLQNVTLIESSPRAKKAANKPEDYVSHISLLRADGEPDSDLDGTADGDEEKKEYIGHVSLVKDGRGASDRGRGWDGTYKGKLTTLRSTNGGHEYSGAVTVIRAVFANYFFDVYFRELIDLTLRRDRLDGDSFFDITYRKLFTEEFEKEAELAIAYRKRIDQTTPLLLAALDCNGENDDCDGLWDKLEVALNATVESGNADDVAFFLPDATPVRSKISFGKADLEVWRAGMKGFHDKKKGLEAKASTPVEITSWDAIIDRVAKATGFDTEMVARSLEVMGEVGVGALTKGDMVEIGNFGSFSVPSSVLRTGRNPQTGATKIAAKKVVRFKAGAALANTVK